MNVIDLAPTFDLKEIEQPEPLVSSPAGRSKFLIFASIAIALFSLLGLGFALWLRTIPAGNPDPRLAFNAFFYLFACHEPAALAIVAAFNIGALALILRSRQSAVRSAEFAVQKRAIWAIAFAVFVITAAGTHFVFQNYLLTDRKSVV